MPESLCLDAFIVIGSLLQDGVIVHNEEEAGPTVASAAERVVALLAWRSVACVRRTHVLG